MHQLDFVLEASGGSRDWLHRNRANVATVRRSIYLFNAQLNQSTELGRWLYQYKDDPEGPSMVIRIRGMVLLALGLAILLFPR